MIIYKIFKQNLKNIIKYKIDSYEKNYNHFTILVTYNIIFLFLFYHRDLRFFTFHYMIIF